MHDTVSIEVETRSRESSQSLFTCDRGPYPHTLGLGAVGYFLSLTAFGIIVAHYIFVVTSYPWLDVLMSCMTGS